MRASLLSGKCALRRLLIPIIALSGLMLPMSNAAAQQREIVEMNNQVIRLYQSGQKTEAISLAEKSVDKSKATLGADNRVTGILLSQLGNFYREVGRYRRRSVDHFRPRVDAGAATARQRFPSGLMRQFGWAGCAGFGPAGSGSTAGFGSVCEMRAPA